jgi:hypothetical protein
MNGRLRLMNTRLALAGFLAPVITGCIVAPTGSLGAARRLQAALAGSSPIVVFVFHRSDDATSSKREVALMEPERQAPCLPLATRSRGVALLSRPGQSLPAADRPREVTTLE